VRVALVNFKYIAFGFAYEFSTSSISRSLNFTDELGDRLLTLLDKKKSDTLTSSENLELEAITELDEIFSCVNGAIASV
jgi:hypothetical protein